MKILIITQMYPQPTKKIETNTVEYFAKKWVEQGHRVIVVHVPSKFPIMYYCMPQKVYKLLPQNTFNNLPSIDSRKKLHRFQFGISIYRIPVFKLYPGQAVSKFRMRFYSNRIVKICKREHFKPDLVAGHFANPSLELVANISEHYSANSSIVFHHDCTRKNIKKYRIKENIKRVSAIGVRSIIEANEIKQLLSLRKEPFVCYSGAPDDAVKCAEVKCNKQIYTNEIRFIYVGSLIPRKHVGETIKAFYLFQKKCKTPCRLEIIGDGEQKENLEKLVEKLNLSDKIHFLGRIPRNEVLTRMKENQIFTLISQGEVYGIVYIEAMLQGCIVIGSKGEGFDGIIKDGVNGFLCNPGDYKMLSKIYYKISNMSEEERNAIGQAAIDTAIHFSESEVAENYLNDILMNQR